MKQETKKLYIRFGELPDILLDIIIGIINDVCVSRVTGTSW